MDKKKVIELIDDAIYQLDPFGMDIDNYEDQCKNATKILYSVQDELKKSDWIPVEDKLPPYGERVLVCDKGNPFDVYVSRREDASEGLITDDNEFAIIGVKVTHWRRIDKLEV